ncbi:Vomeronasal type-2 receptor 26 [Tupaia chinensis]|uniref:Vomeronasal type-2 receptor 26 n=1 Tax=Tupaia chinensis TaxID=246437 RepID=L8YH15_TUPCH|nr:Vomeronasal type-2 receptor 26 [Tupaia chinensis]
MDISSKITTKDLKEKKEVVEEPENGRDASTNGNAYEKNREQEADYDVDKEEEEKGREEEEEEEECNSISVFSVQLRSIQTEKTHCLPKPVTFLAFEDALGIAMVCLALCFFFLTVIILGIFMKHQDTPIVKANNQALTFVLLISLLPCFLCSFLFIGHPNTVTCLLQQITFGLVFTVVVSTVLTKTITVILAFNAMKPGRTMRRLLLSGAFNSVIPICSLTQMIICGIWLGISPPFIDIDSHSEPRNLLMVCNKSSVTAFFCVLGYLGFLALGSFTEAFLARNLSDTFNEAKFLTFSMLVFCRVWVTFVPVYHSTKEKFMVAMEVFSILASSAGILGCIFVPKCYIILIRPYENSWKALKTKRDST